MRSFVHTSHPSRVIFGAGCATGVADEVRRFGASRVLLLAGRHVSSQAAVVEEALEPLPADRFDGAVMHTPVEVTERVIVRMAVSDVDVIVAVGGGSTFDHRSRESARVSHRAGPGDSADHLRRFGGDSGARGDQLGGEGDAVVAAHPAGDGDVRRRLHRRNAHPSGWSGVYDLIVAAGGPTTLAELGMAESDLDEAARLTTERTYPNPREVTFAGVRRLLGEAFAGTRPE